MNINLYSLLDLATHLKHRILLRSAPQGVVGAMRLKAAVSYKNVQGLVNAHNRVSSRKLVVPAGREENAKDLGAVYDETTDTYVVPKGMDEKDEKFAVFWPSAPLDLQNQEGRVELTRDGRLIESRVAPSDKLQGGDSTALFLMYAALPILGSAIAALTLVPYVGWLAWLLVVAAVPYAWAIFRSEGAVEAFRAAALTFVLPLAAAKGLVAAAGDGGLALDIVVAGYCLYLMGGFVYCLAAPVEDDQEAWGGRWSRLKSFFGWSAGIAVALVTTMILPPVIAGFAWFALAGAYGFVYYARDYKERTLVLQSQSARFQLGKHGLLESSTAEALEAQVRKALADKSPFIQFGTALGHQKKKGARFCYDTNSPAGITIEDMFMHTMIWAESGMGKSAYIRWLMAEILKSGYPCAFAVFCGKGALAGEVRGMLETVIETGVHLGLIEGLDAQGVKAALTNTRMEDDDGDIWKSVSADLIDHACVILEALHQHELFIRALDASAKFGLENEIQGLLLVKDRDEASGIETSDLDQAIADLEQRLAVRKDALAQEREWQWTMQRLNKVLIAINDIRTTNTSALPGESLLAAANFLGVHPLHLGNDEQYAAAKVDWAHRLESARETIHPDLLISGSLLQMSFEFVLKRWPTYPAETRGSFMANVDRRITPLMRGKYLVDSAGVPWHSIERGQVNVSDVLKGVSLGVNVPDTRHGTAGILVQNLIAQRLNNGIKLRNEVPEEEWRARGELPVILIKDECQNLIGREDQIILPICRQTKMACFYATQNVDGIRVKLPGDSADQFLGSFQNYALGRTTPTSYKYAESRFGVEEMTTYKQKAVGLDYAGGIEMAMDNALFDPDHPNAAGMKQLRRAGAGRLIATHVDPVTKTRWVGQKQKGVKATKDIEVPASGHREAQPLFTQAEFTGLLNQQGRFILWFNRAGVRRSDICKTPYLPLDRVDEVVKAINEKREAA
ncbi:hypothetical protein ACTT2I_10445 [Stenotrophomonas sp. PUT21]|uniref:hypothetical protein n=1 Tax=Stenotrophomonas sp. PUT21 TaxID=3456954 RepID=UPI003FCED76A